MASMAQDDQSSLLACARGDQRAFQRLYDREASRMLALALQMAGQRSIAEELLVESFILVWKNAESYEPGRGSPRAWIYSILRYRALGRIRQSGQDAVLATAQGLFPSASVLSAAAARAQNGDFLARLARLDDRSRLAVFLAYYKGYPYSRIASTLHLPEEDARDLMRDALYALRYGVQVDGDISPDVSLPLAEYTLGLLRPEEVSRVHDILGSDDSAVIEALEWEARFLGLTDLLAVVPPSAHVFYRIQGRLGHDTVPPPSSLFRQASASAQAPASVVPAFEAVPSVPAAAAPGSAPNPPSMTGQGGAQPPSDTRAELAAPPLAEHRAPEEPTPARPDGAGAGRPPQNAAAMFPPPGEPAVAPEDSLADDAATVRPAHHAHDRDHRIPVLHPRTWPWKLASGVLALALVGVVGWVRMQPPPEPPVTVIRVAPSMGGILQPPGSSSTPAWVVSLDHERNLLFRPLVHTELAPQTVMRLWTQSTPMEPPRLLATANPNQPFTVPASVAGAVAPGQILEMTQEPAGADAGSAPEGPILYLGRIVTFGQEAPVDRQAGPPAASPAG